MIAKGYLYIHRSVAATEPHGTVPDRKHSEGVRWGSMLASSNPASGSDAHAHLHRGVFAPARAPGDEPAQVPCRGHGGLSPLPLSLGPFPLTRRKCYSVHERISLLQRKTKRKKAPRCTNSFERHACFAPIPFHPLPSSSDGRNTRRTFRELHKKNITLGLKATHGNRP